MSEDGVVRAVAAAEWGIWSPVTGPHRGVNRRTWRVGECLWITSMEADRRDLLERENHLLQRLEVVLAGEGLGLAVPRVVPSSSGASVIEVDAWCYRATADLGGARPDRGLEDTFITAARALRALHAALRAVAADLGVLRPFIPETRDGIERALGSDWPTLTGDPDERALVCAAADRLALRLPSLSEEQCQLIHGDWSIPNWLVDNTGAFTAVLDWQMARLGPAIVDLGQLLSGVVMFSGLPVDLVGPKVLRAYGFDRDPELLSTSVLAYWFNNYWFLRDESDRDPGAMVGIGGLERQPARLRRALAFTLSPR